MGAIERTFLAHVPASLPPKQRVPLVLAFHGVGSNASQMALISKLSEIADREGFVVIYPQGLGVVPGWNTGIVRFAKPKIADDVTFVRRLLKHVKEVARIDPQRVYVTGFSNGGLFAHRLACEMSEQIAAIGAVAAINAESSCKPTRVMPVLAFHGLRDNVVLWSGAPEIGVPGPRQSLADWAGRNGCGAEPVLREEAGEVRCEHWPGCRAGAEVILCVAREGSHTWPGGRAPAHMGHTTMDADASELMWKFFQRHPLPKAPEDGNK